MACPIPQILAIECAFPVFSQGPEPDVLFRLVVLLLPVVASAALGGSDTDPTGGPAKSGAAHSSVVSN